MASPENATARQATGPSVEEQSTTGSTVNGSQGAGRNAYADVGAAMRAATARAREANLTRTQYRVFTAVLDLTASYSRLADQLYTAQIAELAGVHPKNARVALGQLERAGVIAYRPARGQGRKSWLSISRNGAGHSVSETEPPVTPFRDQKGVESTPGNGVPGHSPTEKSEKKAAEAAQLTALLDGIALKGQGRSEVAAAYETHPDGVQKTIADWRAKQGVTPGLLVSMIRNGEHLARDTPSRIPAAAESWYRTIAPHLASAEAFEEELAAFVAQGLDPATAEHYRARWAQDAAELADAA